MQREGVGILQTQQLGYIMTDSWVYKQVSHAEQEQKAQPMTEAPHCVSDKNLTIAPLEVVGLEFMSQNYTISALFYSSGNPHIQLNNDQDTSLSEDSYAAGFCSWSDSLSVFFHCLYLMSYLRYDIMSCVIVTWQMNNFL